MAHITLDKSLRPQLVRLDDKAFESFWLTFLKTRPELTANRQGMPVTRRVVDASAYGAKTGMKQKGIDIRAVMEGGEEWAFQCKQVEKFGKSEAVDAVKAMTYSAQHFFLVTTCDPTPRAQDEIKRHPNWTLWGMEEVCAELRTKLRPDQMAAVLNAAILTPSDLRRFLPLASESLVTAERFFEARIGPERVFRHDWPLIGRDSEMEELLQLLDAAGTKAVIIESKGGDGKSRLLLELARKYAALHPEGAALFYNPSRNETLDPLENCFQTLAGPALVIVDDAHRTEEIPQPLLRMAGKMEKVKLVLAGRPQARDALRAVLNEAGITEPQRRWYKLKPLTRSHVKELACLALEGSGFDAAELTRLTHDSAFLTVVAGDLVRRGLLKPGEWTTDLDFRARMFQCFEEENLRLLPAPEDRKLAVRLLRLLALLSPAPAGEDFMSQAAEVLSASEDDVQETLALLERASLVIPQKQTLRVVPDLFSDFLVCESAFRSADQGTTPLVHRVMQTFTTCAPALMRNVAEAGWLAGGDETKATGVLRPLLEEVKAVFRTSCYCRRAALLEMWEKFGLFLPQESLALADESLAMGEPPAHLTSGDDWWPHLSAQLCHRDYMVEKLSPLLQEIALSHKEHQFPALERLWNLAATHEPGWIRHFNAARPLEALAEVFSPSLRRPVEIVSRALQWLEEKVAHPAALKDIAAHGGLLSAIMRSCFSLTASGTWWKGSVVQWKSALQSPATTRCLYDQSLTVLRKVIGQDDLRAAIRAVFAAEPALQGMSRDELELLTGKNQHEALAAFRECILEATKLLKFALERHPHWLMRVAVQRTLVATAQQSLDRVLVPELRRMAEQIPEDMNYRMARAMTGGWNDEDHNAWEPRDQNEWVTRRNVAEQQWAVRASTIAKKLVQAMPEPERLSDYFVENISQLTDAGLRPQPRRLLRVMATAVPGAALGLMHWLAAHPDHGLAWHWTFLLKENPLLPPDQKTEFLCSVIRQTSSELRLAAVQEVLRIPHDAVPAEIVLAALQAAAPTFTPEEAGEVLQSLELSPPPGALWARELFRFIPLEILPREMAPQILRSIIPDDMGWHAAPTEDVERILLWLEPVPEIPDATNGATLATLCQTHPRLVFDFLCRRLDRLEKMTAEEHYEPIPDDGVLSLSALVSEPDFPALCERLWTKAPASTTHYDWRKGWQTLYQAAVLPHPEIWKAPCLARIVTATSRDTLDQELELLSGSSQMIAFRQPDVARAFLLKAEELGGLSTRDRMREALYHASLPESRSWTSGEFAPEHDHVQSVAFNAARENETDPILGPFYRWVVEREEKERQWHRELDHCDFLDMEAESDETESAGRL